MATVKKGLLTRSPQWWRHLCSWKRVFWNRERAAAKRLIDGKRSADAERKAEWRGTGLLILPQGDRNPRHPPISPDE
jgi:hypothetical protein